MTTGWLEWLAASAMIGVSAYHLLRVASHLLRVASHLLRVASHLLRVSGALGGQRPGTVGGELTHLAMSSVMATMFLEHDDLSAGRPLALMFALPLGWFAWRVVHAYVMDGPAAIGAPARQAVGCAVMVCMLLSWSPAQVGGMAMSSSDPLVGFVTSPVVTILLVGTTVGLASLTLVRPRAVGLAPEPPLAAGCQLAMNAAMVYMLIAM